MIAGIVFGRVLLLEQLNCLSEIESVDGQIQELTLGLEKEKKIWVDFQQQLGLLEKLKITEQTTLQEQKDFYEEQSLDVKNSHQLFGKAKDKLNQVRNLKEANAVQRELESTKKFIEQSEKELTRFAGLIKEQEGKVQQTLASYEALKQRLEQQQDKIQSIQTSLKQSLDALLLERLSLMERLSEPFKKRYEMVKKKRWPILTTLNGDTCMGCRMRIPPQLYNTILKEASIENCPTCGRFIRPKK